MIGDTLRAERSRRAGPRAPAGWRNSPLNDFKRLIERPPGMSVIYVDADECPVKEEVYRVATRYGLPVLVVANAWMRAPEDGAVKLEVVAGAEIDSADDWIVAHAGARDIVVTADIPLASRCVAAGAGVADPRGRPFTADNVGEALATRSLLSELREVGDVSGGPAPFERRDSSQFLQKLDGLVQQIRRAK